jgi:tetratricopeptide (TPR) repeat protein
LIRLRLNQAQKELTAQQNLAQANDALQHQQLDMAQPLFQSIPATSVYFTEAKQSLDDIAKSRQVAGYLSNAQALYRDGRITEALTEIDSGLQQASDSKLLLDMQSRVRQMEALLKPLETAESLSQPDNVKALLRDQKTCEDVVALETDPLNSLRKRAQATEAQIADKLVQAAQSAAGKAAVLLQAGNRKDALISYDLAVKANPGDQNVVGLRDQLRQKIVADCRASYQKGIVHEELGQSDQARVAYQVVLKIGIPGEDYYERATRKLKSLAP